jgi:hypothetical protein
MHGQQNFKTSMLLEFVSHLFPVTLSDDHVTLEVSFSVLIFLKTLAKCVKSYPEEQNSEIFIIVGDKNSGCMVA